MNKLLSFLLCSITSFVFAQNPDPHVYIRYGDAKSNTYIVTNISYAVDYDTATNIAEYCSTVHEVMSTNPVYAYTKWVVDPPTWGGGMPVTIEETGHGSGSYWQPYIGSDTVGAPKGESYSTNLVWTDDAIMPISASRSLYRSDKPLAYYIGSSQNQTNKLFATLYGGTLRDFPEPKMTDWVCNPATYMYLQHDCPVGLITYNGLRWEPSVFADGVWWSIGQAKFADPKETFELRWTDNDCAIALIATRSLKRPGTYVLGYQTNAVLVGANILSDSIFDFSTVSGLYIAVSNVVTALGGSITNFPSLQ